MKTLLKSVYTRLYALLPESAGESVSALTFKVANKPFVFHDRTLHPPARLPRGAVTFSADFEMAWAFQYSRSSAADCVALGLRERAQVPVILAALRECGIAITWATVGHLFLSGCTRGAAGLPHPDMPRCGHFDGHWRFTSGDWFQHDPCTGVESDPAWYAPDLVEAILASGHEVGSHGFSHVGFGDYCPDEVAEAEVRASLEAMKPFGIRPRSFVFPGNECGKLDILAGAGLDIVRMFPVSWAEISLPVRMAEGLWGVHSSASIEPASHGANPAGRLRRLFKYVDRAVEERMAAHFWFHPSLQARYMTDLLFPLFRHCAGLREKGVLDIFTMEGLVEETVRAWERQAQPGSP